MKDSFCTFKPSSLELEILSYLTANPQAQDTLEGIVEWWLLEQEILRRKAQVSAALSELVERRLVLEQSAPDGRPRYRINRRKTAAIRKLLKHQENQINPLEFER